MRALNEPIARAANAEDGCTGKFFEARFKSQALLDDKAILACMVYVDLNPIRAQLASTPEDSNFTSIQARIEGVKSTNSSFLASFTGNETNTITAGVPYHLLDYIELVEWTGRATRDDKRGSVDSRLPPILERLGLEELDWMTFANDVESHFGNWVGSPEQFSLASSHVGQRWICNSPGSRMFY